MGNRRFSEFVEIIGKAMPISRAMYKMYHNSYNLLIEAIVSRAICSRFSHAHGSFGTNNPLLATSLPQHS
jgi:hypothetical protein